ncbi:GntR family transcriptional regulator [Acinetobacter soli]|uniref:GntR family transcriptional regulator n=1 Tax=Acinetobacter soli TaxID=487316 RepID=UPI0032184592
MSDALSQGLSQRSALRAPSLNEQAYQKLKQAVITLSYKPGEYLNTAQVMDELEMGRTPINQAIHRLAAEGLLQVLPRKGVMVSPLSINDAIDMIDVRLANEMLCIQLVCKKISVANITQLKQLHVEMCTACEHSDHLQMLALDRQFHQTLLDIANNKWLTDVLSILHAQAQRFWASTLLDKHHMQEVVDEHNQIINALINNQVHLAEEAVQSHILSFRQSLLNG